MSVGHERKQHITQADTFQTPEKARHNNDGSWVLHAQKKKINK